MGRYSDHTTIPTREIPDAPQAAPGSLGASESAQTPQTSQAAVPGGLVKRRRHWLTGEWEEVPVETSGGRVCIAVSGGGDPRAVERILARRNYDRAIPGLSIKPEDATPERIAHENAMAKKHGTGACFDAGGNCHTSTRGSQNRELKRQGKINNNAGYGDWGGP